MAIIRQPTLTKAQELEPFRVGVRVVFKRNYQRGRDMEEFLAGERGTIQRLGKDTADVRMDQDGFVYPIPLNVLSWTAY